MSTTQPGVLPRMVSDMTLAPDSPIPFPCKLQKHILARLFVEFDNSEQNIHRRTVLMVKLFSDLCGSTENVLYICQLMVFLKGCGDEYGSIHTQRILLQADVNDGLIGNMST